VEEAAIASLSVAATKTPVVVLTATDSHAALTGIVRSVQVIPSVDDAAIDDGPSVTVT
jgi:hypothetical protein